MRCDARDRVSSTQALIALVEYLLTLPPARRPSSGGTPTGQLEHA